jgi:periplasmic protein TonB
MSFGSEPSQQCPVSADDGQCSAAESRQPRLATPMRSDARELTAQSARLRPDPTARVRALGERQNRYGMTVGLLFALTVHGAGAVHGYTSLIEMGAFATLVQSAVRDDIRATYAVEMAPVKPPPPPPTPDPTPREPEPQAKAVSHNPQSETPPPAPAQAGKVLTANPDPDAPLDLTGDGFVTGDGDRYVGGVTSAKGTSTTAVQQPQAKVGGKIGSTGTGKIDAVPTKQDLSVPARPAESNWDCPWPPEADTDQINYMRVRIVVTVGLDGRAQKVTVLNDPGHGFARYVQQCAFRKTFNVALSTDGKPVVSTTPPFGVTWTR